MNDRHREAAEIIEATNAASDALESARLALAGIDWPRVAELAHTTRPLPDPQRFMFEMFDAAAVFVAEIESTVLECMAALPDADGGP